MSTHVKFQRTKTILRNRMTSSQGGEGVIISCVFSLTFLGRESLCVIVIPNFRNRNRNRFIHSMHSFHDCTNITDRKETRNIMIMNVSLKLALCLIGLTTPSITVSTIAIILFVWINWVWPVTLSRELSYFPPPLKISNQIYRDPASTFEPYHFTSYMKHIWRTWNTLATGTLRTEQLRAYPGPPISSYCWNYNWRNFYSDWLQGYPKTSSNEV